MIPSIIVALSLGVTNLKGYGYQKESADKVTVNVCWLSVDRGLIWAFVAPAIFVMSVRILTSERLILRVTNTVKGKLRLEVSGLLHVTRLSWRLYRTDSWRGSHVTSLKAKRALSILNITATRALHQYVCHLIE